MLTRRPTSRPFCVAALLSAQLGSAAALAQSPAEDPCQIDPVCDELVKEAGRRSKEQQYEDALQKYQAALARKPVYWLYFNIARVQHKMKRYAEAAGNYQRYLAAAPAVPGADRDRAAARDHLAQAQQELAAQPAAEAPRANPTASVVGRAELGPASPPPASMSPAAAQEPPGSQPGEPAADPTPARKVPERQSATKWIVLGGAGLAVVGGLVGAVVYGIRARVPADTRDLRWSQSAAALAWTW